MSLAHTFTCERCETKAKAKYNGEHYLPPIGWMEFYNCETAATTDEHLCERCVRHALEKEPQEARREGPELIRDIMNRHGLLQKINESDEDFAVRFKKALSK